jgi:TRAP-type mannitol/chloroaromatic compound transport system permease small subunit
MLARLVRLIEDFNRAMGELAAWLVLVTVAVCATVASLRYGFGIGRIWLQELYVVAFGAGFMLMAPRAYAEHAHIRIDVLSHRWGPETRAAIELIGCIVFLIPWLLLIAWASWPFVRLSWLVREPSPQAGGLPGYYLVKSLIPLFAVLMLLQALAAIGRSILTLSGRSHLLPPRPQRAALVE